MHITDMQFSLIAAEARLNYLLASKRDPNQDVDAALKLTRSFLSWLGSSRDDQKLDAQVLVLQARAMYLSKMAGNPGPGVPVPYLKYKAYKGVVDSVQTALRTITGDIRRFQEQIQARKAEEREIDRQKALNENIIKSGKLLERYISAQSSYQESLANHLFSVAAEKAKELKRTKHTVEKLRVALNKQRQAVREAIEDYKEAVVDWETRAMVKAALSIASNLFSLGFTFITPASSFRALSALGSTVQKIQKVIKVFDAIIKAYEATKLIPKRPSKVIKELTAIGSKGLELPSLSELDEMKVNMEAVLAKGPSVGAKVTLNAAFSILVLRGKALIESLNKIQSLSCELSSLTHQVQLCKQQKERLRKLKVTFSAKPKDLDVEAIDLVGLTGQLIFFERQMLMVLASVVVTQGAALQYEYLQPPVPIRSFSLLDLQLTIVNQALAINRGLTVQPPPRLQEEPIVYEIHGVKPDDITNGNVLTFTIGHSKREFASYNYVRVLSIDAEVGGIASTDSGKYYAELTFQGQPFYDRNFNGEPLTFCTDSRLFTFRHDVSSCSHFKMVGPCSPPTHTNGILEFSISSSEDPFGDNISNVTPFSKWQISLPPSASNEGIDFQPEGLTVRLTFHIFAQLKESATDVETRILCSAYLRSRIGLGMLPCSTESTLAKSVPSSVIGLACSSSPDVSKEEVLSMMRTSQYVLAGTLFSP